MKFFLSSISSAQLHESSVCKAAIVKEDKTLQHLAQRVSEASSPVFHDCHETCLRTWLATSPDAGCPECRAPAVVFGAEFERPGASERNLFEEFGVDEEGNVNPRFAEQMRQDLINQGLLPPMRPREMEIDPMCVFLNIMFFVVFGLTTYYLNQRE